MKKVIPSLSVGDLVPVEIVELISKTEMICSFDGDLMRVVNSTNQPLKKGQILSLQVLTKSPLKLAWPQETQKVRRTFL